MVPSVLAVGSIHGTNAAGDRAMPARGPFDDRSLVSIVGPVHEFAHQPVRGHGVIATCCVVASRAQCARIRPASRSSQQHPSETNERPSRKMGQLSTSLFETVEGCAVARTSWITNVQ